METHSTTTYRIEYLPCTEEQVNRWVNIDPPHITPLPRSWDIVATQVLERHKDLWERLAKL